MYRRNWIPTEEQGLGSKGKHCKSRGIWYKEK